MRMDFTKKYDVAVVGGGIAGAAAALQAARSGKKTVLIEKTVLLGGLATSGLVYIYLPICDGNGHQASYGITEELLRNSLEYGPGDIPVCWPNGKNAPESKRFCCRFSPAAFMLSLEELLLNAGVELWLDTLVCDTECTDSRMTAVVVENESGRGRIEAGCFVDASGSCILARRAGLPCRAEDNYLTIWALEYALGINGDFGENLNMKFFTAASLNPPNELIIPAELKTRLYPGMTDDEIRKKSTFNGLSGKSVTEFVTEAHRVLREQFRLHQEKGESRKDRYPVKLPLMPQYRKSYCLDAEYVLKDGENNRTFEDSIGMIPDWRKAGPVWEVPYRSLYTRKMDGLLAAGRCTGAAGDAWEVTRVIPSAGLTGQVAGLAASMAIDQRKEVWELDTEELQQNLRKLGVRIHLPEIGL